MEGKCKKIIEKLINKYEIEVFYHEAMPTNKPSDFPTFFKRINTLDWTDINLHIYDKDDPTIHIGYVRFQNKGTYLSIPVISRTSKNTKHKGVIKQVLYLVICIGIKLGIPIEFDAIPRFRESKGFNESSNNNKLYNYYEKIGFKPQSRLLSSRKYKTTPNNLEGIIHKLNNNENGPTCFGWGCGRTRKRSKQPLPA